MTRSTGPSLCLCNGNRVWGGGEVWHFNTARALAARGWRVFLVCRPDGELFARAASEKNLEVVPLTISRLSFLNPLLHARLRRFFREKRIQALIMNLPSDLKAAAPAARAAGVKHVIYRRGSALPVRDSLLNRWLYGRVITRLIVNSSATMEQALAANPRLLPPKRISMLPNGFDVAAFDLALEKAGAPLLDDKVAFDRAGRGAAPETATGGRDRRPHTGGRPFTLGTAGRLNRQKAQHLFLRLGQKVTELGLNCRLIIAGQGERESELKNLARDLGLGDRVFFAGFMEDLAPFWNSIDIFVLTSLWEGFGNVVIEAGLARKAVLTFAVSNLPDLVSSGVNGRLFPLPEEERANSPAPAKGTAVVAAGGNGVGAGADAAGADYRGATASGGLKESEPLAAMAAAVLELAADPDRLAAMGEAGRQMALRYAQESLMDELEILIK